MTDATTILRPADFSRNMLNALAASDGRRKRRARNTTPDRIGLEIKGHLLRKIVAEDPAPEELEAWLLAQVLAAPASGPVRALCAEILDEYRFACHEPGFARWVLAGAPSDDAERERPQRPGEASCAPGACGSA